MKPHFILAGIILVLSGRAGAEGVFRWMDSAGKVHYGDLPAQEAAGVEQRKFDTGQEIEDASLPYETRRARQNFPVTLYYANNCGAACGMGRDLLNKRGIPYVEKNLATQQELDDFAKEAASDKFPVLAVGKRYLKGFQAEQWSSELDFAGYPRFAPYRPPVALPVPEKASPPQPEITPESP